MFRFSWKSHASHIAILAVLSIGNSPCHVLFFFTCIIIKFNVDAIGNFGQKLLECLKICE